MSRAPLPSTADAAIAAMIRGARTVLFGNGASKFVLLAYEFYLAAHLGAAGFGGYAILVAIVQLMGIISVVGLNFGALQHVAQASEENDIPRVRSVIGAALMIVLGAAVVFGMIVFIASSWLAQSVFDNPALAAPLAIAAIIIPFEALNNVISAIFRGLRLFTLHVATLDMVRNIVNFVFLPVLLFTGEINLWVVFIIYALGTMGGSLFGLVQLYRRKLVPPMHEFSPSVIAPLFNFSKLLMVWNILQVMAVRVFILAAGVILTAHDTGIIAIAARFSLALVFLQTALNATVQGELARMHARKDMDGMKRLYQSASNGLLGFGIACMLLLVLFPNYLLSFFGADYAGYGMIVSVLAIGVFINVVTGPAGQVLVATERQRTMLALTVADVLMQLTVVIGLMKAYGLMGAVAGEALRVLLFVAVRLAVLRDQTGVTPFSYTYAKIATAGLAGVLTGVLLRFYEPSITAHGYMMVVVPAIAIYMAGLWILVRNDTDIRRDLSTLVRFRGAKASRDA